MSAIPSIETLRSLKLSTRALNVLWWSLFYSVEKPFESCLGVRVDVLRAMLVQEAGSEEDVYRWLLRRGYR